VSKAKLRKPGRSARKTSDSKGKVQLVDASGFFQKMRKSLGSKRKELSPEHIEDITRIFGEFKKVTRDEVPISRIFKNEEFGYRTITVERPLRDAKGNAAVGEKRKGKGKPVADSDLRDAENVPLSEGVEPPDRGLSRWSFGCTTPGDANLSTCPARTAGGGLWPFNRAAADRQATGDRDRDLSGCGHRRRGHRRSGELLPALRRTRLLRQHKRPGRLGQLLRWRLRL